MTAGAAATLGRTDLLRSAPAENLRPVAAACRVRNFRRGQAAFTRDDLGDTVIGVISGHVKAMIRSRDGGALTLAIIGPGGLFGELGFAGPPGRRYPAERQRGAARLRAARMDRTARPGHRLRQERALARFDGTGLSASRQ